MTARTAWLDRGAATLSALCLVHCLALPALAVSLPLAGLLAEAEWLHRLFVLLAIPLSLLAFSARVGSSSRALLRVCAVAGSVLLLLGAFVESLHDYETPLTVAGALLLGAAHLMRLLPRPHRHDGA